MSAFLTHLPDEIIRTILSCLVNEVKPLNGVIEVEFNELNPFRSIVERGITTVSTCRLVCRKFKQLAEDTHKLFGVIFALRSKLVNYSNYKAIKAGRSREMILTLASWWEINERRTIVPMIIDKIFNTIEDRPAIKKWLTNLIFLDFRVQTMALPSPIKTNAYILLRQCRTSDDSVSFSFAECSVQRETSTEPITNLDIYNDYRANYKTIKAIPYAYVLDKEFYGTTAGCTIMTAHHNKLMDYLGSPQWRVNGQEDPIPSNWPRFLLALFGYYRLALDSSTIYWKDPPPRVVFNISWQVDYAEGFYVIDPQVAEVIPIKEKRPITEFGNSLKNTLANQLTTKFETIDQARMYFSKVFDIIVGYWTTKVFRFKNRDNLAKGRFHRLIYPETISLVQFSWDKMNQIMDTMESIRCKQYHIEFIRKAKNTGNEEHFWDRAVSISYILHFNEKQSVHINIDKFKIRSYFSLMARCRGLTSAKDDELIQVFVDGVTGDEAYELFLHQEVIEEIKPLLGLGESVANRKVIKILDIMSLMHNQDPLYHFINHPSSLESLYHWMMH